MHVNDLRLNIFYSDFYLTFDKPGTQEQHLKDLSESNMLI